MREPQNEDHLGWRPPDHSNHHHRRHRPRGEEGRHLRQRQTHHIRLDPAELLSFKFVRKINLEQHILPSFRHTLYENF